MKQRNKNIQIILIFVFVVLASVLFFLLQARKDYDQQQQLQRITERYQFAYNTIYGQYKMVAKSIHTGVIERFAIQDVYQQLLTADEREKNRLRDELLSKIRPRYEDIQKVTMVRQLHFHLRDNESFLRLHRPKNFGDNLTEIRPTVAYVNRVHLPINGFEEGRIFNGYRFVFPVTGADQSHLGSIEISFGPEALTSAMMEQYDVLSNFFIKETVVTRKLFPNEQAGHYTKAHHKGYLYDANVLAALKRVTHKKMKELKPQGATTDAIYANAHSGRAQSCYDSSINMVFTTIPVVNPVTQKMVAFFSVRSQPDVLSHIEEHFKTILFLGLILLAMILYAFYLQFSKKIILESNTKLLKKQRQRLIGAQKIADLGDWELDLVTNALSWSKQTFHIFDLQPEEISPSFEYFLESIHPDDRDFVNTTYLNSIKNQTPYDVQHRMVSRKGTEKWVREIGTTEYDKAGKAVRSFGIIQDITQSKQAEGQLRKLSRAVEQSHSTIVITDLDGTIEFVNPAFTQITGYLKEEVIGQNPRVLKSEHHDAAFYKAMWNTLIAGEVWQGEMLNKRKDGSLYWEFATISPVKDENGQNSHYVAVKEDISKRKDIEAELKHSNKRFIAILDSLDALVYVTDMQTNELLFINNYGKKTWGEDVIGNTCWKVLQPNQSGPCTFCTNDHLLDINGRPTGVYAWERQDTTNQNWYHCRDIAIRWPDGRMVRIEIATNITDLKKMESDLIRAGKQAETANEAKSNFLANMSHDIRTPMNGIIGMTKMALDRAQDPNQIKYLESIEHSARSLLGLLNDILDFSKIEAGQLFIEDKSFNLHGVLDNIISIMAFTAKEKGLELTLQYNVPGLLGYVKGDDLRLRQILVNLIGNSVKFTEKGSVILKVSQENREDNQVGLHFRVIDTGIGIPADKQKTIFSSFNQADTSITRKFGGTGLGLTICKQLVELMGGRIWLESIPEQGATFNFTVVLGHGKKESIVQQDDTASSQCRQLDVLLVDDNNINCEIARYLLERDGHRVVVAGNGLESLEIIANQDFDLILMDVQMPIMDGLTASTIIRACENNSDLSLFNLQSSLSEQLIQQCTKRHNFIVAMTANAMEGDKEKCLAAGMDSYLTKPFEPEQIRTIIADTVNV